MQNLKEGIRVVSDGNPQNTRVINLATGEEIPHVKSISIDIDPINGVQATMDVIVSEIDIVAPPLQLINETYETSK